MKTGRAERPDWARAWFARVIEESRFSVRTLPLSASSHWREREGAIRHESGRFFSVVGTSWRDSEGGEHTVPLLEQREIGTLGFLMRRRGTRRELLAQAKVEPGNVGICQIGPSFQATASNSGAVHGGAIPAYRGYFGPGAELATDVLHSEQGTRFLGKLNRNAMAIVDQDPPASPLHRWVDVRSVLAALRHDNFINTDARSVLVCAPWEELVSEAPFSTGADPIARDFADSLATVDPAVVDSVLSDLDGERAAFTAPEIVPLGELPAWRRDPTGFRSDAGAYRITQIAVRAVGREVASWDQPIVDSTGRGRVDLFCARVNGVLRLCFVPRAEAGLLHGVELGPTIAVQPGGPTTGRLPRGARVLARVRQSDEGGRFFRDVTTYRLVLVDDSTAAETLGAWLTLGEVRALLARSGTFTNEARSALSLVLCWL